MAKLIYQCDDYDTEVSIKVPADLDIYEFLDYCKRLAIAISYSEDNWNKAILIEAKDIENDRL